MLDANLYEKLFRLSLLIRRVEEKIIEIYPTDKIQSPVHLSIGQEAVSVGLCTALQPKDMIFGCYRSRDGYEHWEARDPLVQDKAMLKKLLPQVDAEIAKAVARAEASPPPGLEELLTDVV